MREDWGQPCCHDLGYNCEREVKQANGFEVMKGRWVVGCWD